MRQVHGFQDPVNPPIIKRIASDVATDQRRYQQIRLSFISPPTRSAVSNNRSRNLGPLISSASNLVLYNLGIRGPRSIINHALAVNCLFSSLLSPGRSRYRRSSSAYPIACIGCSLREETGFNRPRPLGCRSDPRRRMIRFFVYKVHSSDPIDCSVLSTPYNKRNSLSLDSWVSDSSTARGLFVRAALFHLYLMTQFALSCCRLEDGHR